jgi:hypothetical protein
MDFKAIIDQTQDVLNAGADHAALRRIRSTVDDPVFLVEWKEYLRTTNNHIAETAMPYGPRKHNAALRGPEH